MSTHAWGRAPDRQRAYRKGQKEAMWINGDRAVSVFTFPIMNSHDGRKPVFGGKKYDFGVEICLMYRVVIDGEEDWMLPGEGLFDGKSLEARAQAWVWLEGGAWPTVKPL
jgi:hypothetical protein